MSGEEPSEMLKILLEAKNQMAELEGKVDSKQRTETSNSFDAANLKSRFVWSDSRGHTESS